ncbi:MAG TPA: hypothetical protein VFU47_09090 [Armatimonadota bacterium]|nr:hypothetical protein [Armatimonadota bacterium]
MGQRNTGEHGARIYRIIRFYRDGRRPRTIRRNVTRAQAQAHCSDPATRQEGVYFDGFDYMPGCAPRRTNGEG